MCKETRMASLFAGIGGFDLAFKKAGIPTSLMCEIDPVAQHVLKKRFPKVNLIDDVRSVSELPNNTDILCAGFPCQDLSSAGEKMGMSGDRSSLVTEVLRILELNRTEWVLFENVPFMLRLNKGEAISTIINKLEQLGYKWAYRTIDSISFIPQHRARVFILASLNHDPRMVLLSDNANKEFGQINKNKFERPLGFYWTEGKNALGLISNAIPTLKAGSTIGIPSQPAIAFTNGDISTPNIKDAERLQGFPANWTLPAEEVGKASIRWKLVGNAVTVKTVSWIANKLLKPKEYDDSKDKLLVENQIWPKAAWGDGENRYISNASLYPVDKRRGSLDKFLRYETEPLSLKAAKGFYKRLIEGHMHSPNYFVKTISDYINRLESYDAK